MSEFKKYDLIIGKDNTYVYSITNSTNPCVVLSEGDNKVLRNITNRRNTSDMMIVSPLKKSIGGVWEVEKRYFDKIATKEINQEVELDDSICIYKKIPKGLKCRLISIVEEKDFIEKYGDAVVYIPKTNEYIITSKEFIKNREF